MQYHTHTHIYTHTHTKEIRKETLPGFQAAMRGENTCLMAVSPGGFTYPGQLVTRLPCYVITQHFYWILFWNRMCFCCCYCYCYCNCLATKHPWTLCTAINYISIKREAHAETSSTGVYVWIKMSASLPCLKVACNPGDKMSPIIFS